MQITICLALATRQIVISAITIYYRCFCLRFLQKVYKRLHHAASLLSQRLEINATKIQFFLDFATISQQEQINIYLKFLRNFVNKFERSKV